MSLDDSEMPRVLALDYGQARVGLALSDELGFLAHPRPFVPAKPPLRALRLIKALCKEEKVQHILVGLPLNMNGSEGMSARLARKFAADVAEKTGLEVELIDERLSTVAAQGRLHSAGKDVKQSRSQIDSASAAILLQSWLDGKRREL